MSEKKVWVTINDDAPDDLKVDSHKLTAGETVELLPRQADGLVMLGHAKRAEPAKLAATKTAAATKSTKR